MNGATGLLGRENYPIVPLEELCDLCSGITKGRKIDSTVTVEVPYMAVANVQDGSLKLDNVKTIEATPEEIHRYRLLPGDLLLTEGGDPDKLGRGAIWNGEITSCIHQNHIFRARKATQHVDMEYLAHLVSSPYGKRYFLRQSKQTTGIASINMSQLKRFPVPLPPLEEQRRIAAILDKAQDIKTLCDKAEKLSEIADRNLFLHYFAEQPGVNEITLEDIVDRKANAMRTGPFGSQLLHSEFTEAGIAVLGIDNAVTNNFTWGKRRYISEEKYRQLERYTVFPGDLLITIMGTCGRVAVVPDDIPTAINTKHLCAISVNQDAILPDYLHDYILYHPFAVKYLARQTKGAIMEGLNMSIIKQIPVFLPPLEKQLKWHSRRKLARAIASKNRQSQGSLSRLASSLNQILLNGYSS